VSEPLPLPNPFDDVSDEDLYEMQVSLTYGCLRSKAAIDKRHKKYVCALQTILDQQALDRGSARPHFPYPPPPTHLSA